jgi:predicted MFS family arabinose efflux permease
MIGSVIAVGNWFVPALAMRVNERCKPPVALALGGAVAALALAGLVPAWPWLGLVPAMILMLILGFVGFTVSRHLHREAESHQRATLLSVKGLVFNLAYGTYSLVFSLTLAGFGDRAGGAFQAVLAWQAGLFALAVAGFALYAIRASRKCS